jgi:L-threonylcarbamoyladenylate synthase
VLLELEATRRVRSRDGLAFVVAWLEDRRSRTRPQRRGEIVRRQEPDALDPRPRPFNSVATLSPGDPVTEELARAVEHLRGGGVVAVATETYFGLCADVRRTSAVEAVFALKGRDEPRACALLLPDESQWPMLVREVPKLAKRLAARFWPGPLTISLPASDDLHPLLRFNGNAAVRIPGASPALELVRAFGSPLTATSANPSGAPSPLSHEDVRGYFEGRGPLLILEGRALGGMPSTVVQIGDDDRWSVSRPGAVPTSVLEQVAAEVAAA